MARRRVAGVHIACCQCRSGARFRKSRQTVADVSERCWMLERALRQVCSWGVKPTEVQGQMGPFLREVPA
jgi:hypothetical protein